MFSKDLWMVAKFNSTDYEDSVSTFMINETVRGRFVRVDQSLSRILAQHNYPARVSRLIAEAVLLAIMVGQAIKLKWKLSLQIRGSGPVKLIAVDYFSPKDQNLAAEIRGYAKFDSDSLGKNLKSNLQLFGAGFFAILIDQRSGDQPYQGITPLKGNSLVDCAETYFEQSEQLPTAFKIVLSETGTFDNQIGWRGGGIMLQQLPKTCDKKTSLEIISAGSGTENGNLAEENFNYDSENWSRMNFLLETVEADEIIGPAVTPIALLNRLYYQESLRIFKPQSVRFGCSCSIKKVSRALSIYSPKDIKSMITESGDVTADCQFCGRHFVLDPRHLGFGAKG